MRRSLLALVVISSLVLAAVPSLASSRPRYGGTVRVLLRHKITSLDPLQESDDPASRDRVASLIYETLTAIDAQGRTRPRLATSWQADSARRVWQFNLRAANFHDGSPVTAATVAASLKSANPEWKFFVSGKLSVTIETPSPVPHLPELLALARFSIIKRSGALMGSGPYTLTDWQPGERALLTAYDDYWGGRSFPDNIDFRMGLSLREHLMERNLGSDHAVELGVDQARGLEQSLANQTLLVSRPADLVVLLFLQPNADATTRPARKQIDPRIREALADSINRTAISNVLLQKKGAPAGGLLPQWMTGYEFLFPGKQDMDRARKLRTDAGTVTPITLAYDASDPVMKTVAERIAVDARESSIPVQPLGDLRINTKSGRAALNADAVLLRLPLRSLDPAASLFSLADDLALSSDTVSAIQRSARPEELAEVERKTLADYRIIPVVHLSQVVWTNGNVHNWQQLPNGDWDLDRLWVEGTK
jgi:peptide/nickel transport system substrate-binding protein